MNVLKAEIKRWEDVLAFRNETRIFIKGIFLKEEKKEKLLLALTELGNNLITHSVGGFIEVNLDDEFISIRAVSKKVEKSDKKASLGIGLVSVRDIMDELAIKNNPDEYEVIAKMRINF